MTPNRVQGGAGCGGGNCTCGGGTAQARAMPAAVNGIGLHEEGERVDEDALRERAWGELLRQEAVRQGRLPRHTGLVAPGISAGDEAVIQQMLEAQVPLHAPGEQECVRYYAAHTERFRNGRRARMRHILFAVTEAVDVPALAGRAEQALLELAHKDASAARFAELARELSNCPSGREGGELGWTAPEELAEELARALFGEHAPLGLVPRLVHSRYGFHIVEVLEREDGRQVPYPEVRQRIATELAQRSRATALHQYIRLLAGQAVVEGVELEAAESPLVQ